MHQPTTRPSTTAVDHDYDEADIGSGEKTPAERETEEMIRSVPALPADSGRPGSTPAPAP